MRQLPILFSTPMVEAILENRKTMTRRMQGLKQMNYEPHLWRFDGFNEDKLFAEDNSPYFEVLTEDGSYTEFYKRANPRYQVGDQLWVKETFFEARKCRQAPLFHFEPDFLYKADKAFIGENKWKPSLFMPKEAARLWLEVTNVRCERLQDITEADAIAEGVLQICDYGTTGYLDYTRPDEAFSDIDAKLSFETLWESINGKKSWVLNPWIFAYTFKRIPKP